MPLDDTNQPSGFWSYVHDDDDSEGGRILKLAVLLQNEYRLLTGKNIEIFTDHDIAWGEKWEETIDEAITTTTFFISIVTQNFIQSQQCRRELLLFSRNAAARSVPELLLPILYSPVDGLTKESSDEVKAAIAAAQYEPFDSLRLEDQDSPIYRKAVNKLALRLVQIAKDVEKAPELLTPAVADPALPIDEYGDSPGILDAVADAEQLFPEWKDTIERFSEIMGRITEITNVYNPKMTKAGNKNAAAKLFVAKQFAQELMPVAEEFRDNGHKYAEQAIAMNSNIVTVLTQVASRDKSDIQDAYSFMEQIRGLAEAGKESIISIADFQDTIRDVAKMSRDVRRPLLAISEGAQSFIDGQQLFDDWVRRIDEIELRGDQATIIDEHEALPESPEPKPENDDDK